MNTWDIMKARHSVRKYLDKAIPADIAAQLQAEIDACNREGGLHFQLFLNEPNAFQGDKPHYGAIQGCKNYFVLAGPKQAEEAAGYYGERLVLRAQELGLNTCWVAMTYKKGAVQPELAEGEKLHIVIALGYGENQGVPHRSKTAAAVSDCDDAAPQWYKDGIAAALLAPTAINQQQFAFKRNGNTVTAKAKLGFCVKIDLGIVKYHFALGAGKDNFRWG